MKKRNWALILALIMLASSSAGCSEGSTENTPASESSAAENAGAEVIETVEEEPEWKAFDNLPEQNFEGQTYTILSRMENETQFHSEETTGDAVNDSVFDRNLAVMGRYNIKIEVSTIDGSWANNERYIADIRSSIQSGDGAYELIDGYAAVVGSLVVDGCYYLLNDIKYMEPTERWWSPSAVEDLAIDGNVYLTPGDISMSLYDNIFAFFFNQRLFDEFQLEDPYTLVDEGRWTYDKFLELSAKCLIDSDGNGVYNGLDTYGAVFSDDLEFNNFHFAFRIPITVKGDDGRPVLNLGDESVADLVDTMKTLAYGTEGVYYAKGDDTSKMNMFMAGQCAIMPNLLGSIKNLRDVEDNFGVLPYPKKNEDQEGYYTTSRDNSILFGIPVDVKDADFAGFISEALCQASYEMVKPIYYENVLKTKLARDEESQKMIDILRDGIILDPGAVYSLQLQRAGFLVRDCVYYEYEYASYYRQNQKKFEKVLEQFLESFGKGEE